MLLQALRVETKMKNLNLQATFLAQKGVGTRSHTKTKCGNAIPTRSPPTTPLPACEVYAASSEAGQMKTTNTALSWPSTLVDTSH